MSFEQTSAQGLCLLSSLANLSTILTTLVGSVKLHARVFSVDSGCEFKAAGSKSIRCPLKKTANTTSAACELYQVSPPSWKRNFV